MPFLTTLSKLLTLIKTDLLPLKVESFDQITQAISACANEFVVSQVQLSSCINYCQFYKMNQDLPVYEGYPELFYNMLAQVFLVFPELKTANRILEVKSPFEDSDHFLRKDSLLKFEQKKKKYERMLSQLNELGRGRLLQNDVVDDLNPEVISAVSEYDPYDLEFHDQNFDSFMSEQIVRLDNEAQQINDKKHMKMIKEFYLNNYSVSDTKSTSLFKQMTDEQIPFENLRSEFGQGITQRK